MNCLQNLQNFRIRLYFISAVILLSALRTTCTPHPNTSIFNDTKCLEDTCPCNCSGTLFDIDAK